MYTADVEKETWEKNLTVIARRWPELAEQLGDFSIQTEVQGARSRDDEWVLQINGQAIHSMYAPKRESQRFCNECKAGSVLFLGLGCGYQILPFLARGQFHRFLIVDMSLSRIKAVLAKVDQSEILSDPRVELAVFDHAEDFAGWLPQHYHPVWQGQLVNYPLRPLIEQDMSAYQAILTQLSDYFYMLSGDLSSQAFFAKTWFRNILTNLYTCANGMWSLPAGNRAIVAGAGPSLEAGIKNIAADQKKGSIIIACDAALRPLLCAGIQPDIVLSLDAQQIVARHFVGVAPKQVNLLCDIASPPSLARTYGAHFFAGGHPLAQITGLMKLDTQGGNVGYAALALAKSLYGHVESHYGFDFCFPQGKPYARGVYVYPEYLQTAQRTAPYENYVLSLVLRYQHLYRQEDFGRVVYTPEIFLSYQKNFEKLFSSSVVKVSGFEFNSMDGPQFIAAYKENILQLDLQAWRNPTLQQHDIYLSLAPLVSYFIGQDMLVEQAWSTAIEWAQNFLQNWNIDA